MKNKSLNNFVITSNKLYIYLNRDYALKRQQIFISLYAIILNGKIRFLKVD